MVTAGVYLIARTHVLFELAPAILDLAAVLGAVTLLAAGLIALVQTDIKRVIAYSTMSQIGYMFLGAGLGAYGPSLFHLMTHAFFKALLFLAAGIVIHALSGEQDIRRMGGLGRELPWTTRAFLVGTLALAAIPPFAGFFSKDEILAHSLAEGAFGTALFVVGVIGAFLTAVYAFRLFFVVFRGPKSEHVQHHLHRERFEGPLAMMWPVAILAVLSTVGGFIQIPGAWAAINDFVEPVAHSLQEPEGWMEVLSPIVSVTAALLGIALAWRLWGQRSDAPARLRSRYPLAARTLEHKLWFDEAYDALFSRPSQGLAVWLGRVVESPLVLGSAGGIADSARALGRRFAAAQTGALRAYAILIALGAAVVLLVFIAIR
jgi:NADH-quinone oxidoreductase subunit L